MLIDLKKIIFLFNNKIIFYLIRNNWNIYNSQSRKKQKILYIKI